MKVGIIGGAFDPVTKGHIELARFALSHGNFDEIWLMPCYKHMYGKDMASAEHRLEMCHLAAGQYTNIAVFSYEIEHKMEMSTYDVITNLLKEEWSKYYKFNMVIGLDNANNFEKWVKWELLKDLIDFTVVARKGVNRDVTKTWYLNGGHSYIAKDNLTAFSPFFSRTFFFDLAFQSRDFLLRAERNSAQVFQHSMPTCFTAASQRY